MWLEKYISNIFASSPAKEEQREAWDMASWNSGALEITYQVLGWTAFSCWSISFYPQVILNFRRQRFILISPTTCFHFCFIIFFTTDLTKIKFSFFFRLVGFVSVVGLNFDFVLLNLIKHSSYLIYNASMYFSKAVQQQYFEEYGYGEVTSMLWSNLFNMLSMLTNSTTLILCHSVYLSS